MRTDKPIAARLATFTFFFANGFGFGSWAAAIPPLKMALGLSPGQLSFALLAAAVGGVVMMQATGRLVPLLGGSGRAGRLAGLGYAVLLAFTTAAPSLAVLCAVTLTMGAVNGLMDVSMNAHAATIERRWGAAIMSSFHAGFSLGGLVGAGFTALAIGRVPISVLMVPAAVMVFLMVFCAGRFLGKGDVAAASGGFSLPDRRLVNIALIGLFSFFVEGAIADWGGLYMTTVGAGAATAAAGFVAFSTCMVAGRLTGDLVVRRLGGLATLVARTLPAALGLYLAVAFPRVPVAILGFALVGIGLANVVPVAFSTSVKLGRTAASSIATVATAGYTSMLAGPPLIGAIANRWSLRAGMAVLATAALTAAVLAFVMRMNEEKRRRAA